MSSKINNLSELATLLINEKETDKGILHFLSTFKVNRLLESFNVLKTKGISVSSILYLLITIRLRSYNVHNEQNHKISSLPSIEG